MTDKLNPLPCPFCGDHNATLQEGSTFRWVVIQCGNCGAQCGEVRVNTMKTKEERGNKPWMDAVAEWNRRAT